MPGEAHQPLANHPIIADLSFATRTGGWEAVTGRKRGAERIGVNEGRGESKREKVRRESEKGRKRVEWRDRGGLCTERGSTSSVSVERRRFWNDATCGRERVEPTALVAVERTNFVLIEKSPAPNPIYKPANMAGGGGCSSRRAAAVSRRTTPANIGFIKPSQPCTVHRRRVNSVRINGQDSPPDSLARR